MIKEELINDIKKRLIPIILLMVLFSSFAYADITTNLIHRYPLTADGDDVVGSDDFSNTGVDFTSGEYGDFESSESDYLEASVSEITPAIANDWTLCAKISYESAELSGILYETSKSFFISWSSGGAGSRPEYGTSVKALYNYADNPSLDTWYSVCWVKSSTTVTIYWDGVSKVTDSGNWGTASATGNARIGATPSQYFDGKMKELCVWSEAIDSTDLSDYTSDGCSVAPPPSQPSVILNTSLTNNTINYKTNPLTFTYNGTFTTNTIDLVNISFYQQGVLNTTLLDVNLSINNVFNITLPINYTGYYNVSFNVSNFEVNASSGVYIYNVDLVPPDILISANLINHTRFPKSSGNITISANITDENLKYANFTIRNINLNGTNGDIIYNHKNMTISTDIIRFLHKINFTDVWDWTVADISIEGWDDHTAKEIKKYDIKTENKGKKKTFDNELSIISDDILSFDTIKQKDRYEFDMNFNKKQPLIYVESIYKLEYLKNSEYSGHFVCYECGEHGKWIDFMEETDIKPDYYVEKISDYKYLIVPLSNKKDFNFKSIGDLNYNSAVYRIHAEDDTEIGSWEHNTTTYYNFTTTTPSSNITVSNFIISLNGLYANGGYPNNISIYIDDYLVYEHNGSFVGADLDIDLNKTLAIAILQTKPNVTINVSMEGSTGLLNMFNYELAYTRGIELSFSEQTTGTIYYIDGNKLDFNTTVLGLNYTQITDEKAIITFNNNLQVYEIWKTDTVFDRLARDILVTGDLTEEIYVNVRSNVETSVIYARVELSEDRTTEVVYSRITNANGEATILGNTSKIYRMCAYKEGYTSNEESCRNIVGTDFGTTVSLKLLKSETVIGAIDVKNQNLNVTSPRVDLSILKSWFRNKEDMYFAGFAIILLGILVGIIAENRYSSSGAVVFSTVMLLFMSITWLFAIPMFIVMLRGIVVYIQKIAD